MLKTSKSINLSGRTEIDGKQAVYYSATINVDDNSSTNVNQSVTDQTLYNQNKAECRQDFNEFQEAVWVIEDEIVK